MQATAVLTVDVQDINDNTPVCSPAVYTLTLAEGLSGAQTLASVACTDNDAAGGSYGTSSLTYALSENPSGAGFSVSAAGVVSTSSTYELV